MSELTTRDFILKENLTAHEKELLDTMLILKGIEKHLFKKDTLEDVMIMSQKLTSIYTKEDTWLTKTLHHLDMKNNKEIDLLTELGEILVIGEPMVDNWKEKVEGLGEKYDTLVEVETGDIRNRIVLFSYYTIFFIVIDGKLNNIRINTTKKEVMQDHVINKYNRIRETLRYNNKEIEFYQELVEFQERTGLYLTDKKLEEFLKSSDTFKQELKKKKESIEKDYMTIEKETTNFRIKNN